MLVTNVHAKFERNKGSKCEVPNEGDLAHIQGIALVKFIMRRIVFITLLHTIKGRYNGI